MTRVLRRHSSKAKRKLMGQSIAKLRRKAKLEQAYVAKRMSVNAPKIPLAAYRRMEKGGLPISNLHLQRLSELFAVPVYTIRTGKKPPPPKEPKPEPSPSSIVTVTVDGWSFYRKKAVEFSDMLSAAMKEIPRKYRKKAELISCLDEDDPHFLVLEYDRPETAKEVADRVKADKSKAKEAALRERETYERLKEKYG